jgi:hypothetical protein
MDAMRVGKVSLENCNIALKQILIYSVLLQLLPK